MYKKEIKYRIYIRLDIGHVSGINSKKYCRVWRNIEISGQERSEHKIPKVYKYGRKKVRDTMGIIDMYERISRIYNNIIFLVW